VRVLVVEDEGRLARQLERALADAGYAVDCAADGERADFLGHTERYDAVLLDLGLPKVDGLTLLRRWRDAGLDMPVLVLTARGSWHEKVQGIDVGADDYVAKPWRKCWPGCARSFAGRAAKSGRSCARGTSCSIPARRK